MAEPFAVAQFTVISPVGVAFAGDGASVTVNVALPSPSSTVPPPVMFSVNDTSLSSMATVALAGEPMSYASLVAMATVTEPSASPSLSSTVAMVTVADVKPPRIVTEVGSVALMNSPVCELLSRTSSAIGWAMPRSTVNVAAVPSVTGEAPG